MKRVGLGLVVGALAVGGALLLDLRWLPLLALVVALVAGLLVGALVGWRAPQPGAALLQGGLAGLLAGALLALAVWRAGLTGAHLSGFSGVGALGGVRLTPLAPLAQTRLTASVALACALLCVALGAICAGLVSGWTGYGRWSRQARRTRGIANVSQQPARGPGSGPLGPAPESE